MSFHIEAIYALHTGCPIFVVINLLLYDVIALDCCAVTYSEFNTDIYFHAEYTLKELNSLQVSMSDVKYIFLMNKVKKIYISDKTTPVLVFFIKIQDSQHLFSSSKIKVKNL